MTYHISLRFHAIRILLQLRASPSGKEGKRLGVRGEGTHLCFEFTPHALLFVCANEHMELVQILDDKRLAWFLVQRDEYLFYR
jgi:hypothetical protein